MQTVVVSIWFVLQLRDCSTAAVDVLSGLVGWERCAVDFGHLGNGIL